MAEVAQEKSRGLKFAEKQLLRHGWEHGKGLGRAENGISEAIKVKVKCDKGGVGHKEGEQFTFHWWDHVFNKASSSLQVETDQSGIKLKKTEDEEDGTISNRKPRKALMAKNKLYGCFVKSATLLSGQEQPEPKSSGSDGSSSSSSDEDEEQKLDLSSTTKLTDSDLIKACGGRTAHKGARHGLTMSAKLARLERQEAEFMSKYGKKSQPARSSSVGVAPTPLMGQTEEEEESHRKKTKKKRSKGSFDEVDGVCENPETEVQPKKKKKKKKEEQVSTEGGENCEESRSKKRRNVEQSGAAGSDGREGGKTLLSASKGKKKKSSTNRDDEAAEEEEGYDEESSQAAHRRLEERPVTMTTVKQKRKKSKKDKRLLEKNVDEEPLHSEKKKKKKSNDQ